MTGEAISAAPVAGAQQRRSSPAAFGGGAIIGVLKPSFPNQRLAPEPAEHKQVTVAALSPPSSRAAGNPWLVADIHGGPRHHYSGGGTALPGSGASSSATSATSVRHLGRHGPRGKSAHALFGGPKPLYSG
jgi:hypothetical protein